MTIEFNCGGCQYPFKVPDSMAGKKGKCPKCGVVTAIPMESTGSPISAVPPRPRQIAAEPDDLAFDRDPDGEPIVRRKRKKSSKGLIIGLSIAGVLLLVGVPLLLWALGIFGGGLSSDELKFLPNGTQAVVSIKPAEFFDSGFWKDMKKDMTNGVDIEKEMQEKTGFAPKDIERVTLGGSEADMAIIVKMKKSVKPADIQNALKKSPIGGVEMNKESKVGSYTMYKTESDEAPAFCIVNGNIVVGSNKASTLEKILKRDKKPDFSASFKTVMDKADFSKTVAAALDLKALKGSGGGLNNIMQGLNAAGGGGGMMNPMMFMGMMGDKVDGIALSLKFNSGIDAKGTLICKDAETAKNFKTLADAGITAAKTQPGAPPEAKEMLNKVSISVSGNAITGSISIKPSLFEKLQKR